MKTFSYLLLFLSLLLPGFRVEGAITKTTHFENLPVLEGGRVMPMDSFARNFLLSCSGRTKLKDASASAWLAEVLFNPEGADNREVFLINHPEVAEAMELPAEGRHRYSFAELSPRVGALRRLVAAAMEIDEKERGLVESESIRLLNNLMNYAGLRTTFRYARPLEDLRIDDEAMRTRLKLPAKEGGYTLFEILKVRTAFDALYLERRGIPVSEQTPGDQTLFRIQQVMTAWSQDRSGSPLALIPLPGHANDQWVSPEQLLRFGVTGSSTQEMLEALHDLSLAYQSGTQALFDIAGRRYSSLAEKNVADGKVLGHLSLETWYNHGRFFSKATWYYGFAFLAVMVSILVPNRLMYVVALLFLAAAIIPHAIGIVLRMIIMGRPPVTNLYATFIFVGLICVVLGLVVEFFQRNRLGLLLASLSGLALLLVAGRFATDGDTMRVVVAVLDSNFWLATHVVCITIGYAGCCAAGLLGHAYLLLRLRKKAGAPVCKETFNALYGTLAFGLICAFFGTMLGGVWADQSWGRFWGWDPKENGALLIVLWSAIIFHARMGGMIKEVGFAAGSVLGVIAVMMAWLGVNLLGVGLHSYGFTSSLAMGFFGVCGFEVLFVLVLVPLIRARKNKPTAFTPPTPEVAAEA